MPKNEYNKDWVRRMLKQQTRMHNSKEQDKIVKDAAKDLVNSMIKIFKPEILLSESQRILSQLDKLPGRLPISTEKFDDGTFRIYELDQLHQFQHLPYYLKLRTANEHNKIAVLLDVSKENRRMQTYINRRLLSNMTEDDKFAKSFIKCRILKKGVFDQKRTFLSKITWSKKRASLLTGSILLLPEGFEKDLFMDYLKAIPSLSDTYNSEVLTAVAMLRFKTGEPKYINFLNQASRVLFSGDQDHYKKTQISRIARDHFLYQRHLSNSASKYPFQQNVTDLHNWCEEDDKRKSAERSTAEKIIGNYKIFHKLYDDLSLIKDLDFIDFLAWTRNQISKDTRFDLSI